MLAPTSQMLIIVLLAILLPSALSFPYSIYNMKNRRASRASSSGSTNAGGIRTSSSINNNKAIYSEPREQYDFDQSAYRSSAGASAADAAEPTYFDNPDTIYDTGADNFYADDESFDDRPEREYLYGKPTYHGEYKPTRYYYARAPSYSYYNDHTESTNPLDDLHEQMLQEDHNRQRNRLSGGKTSATAAEVTPQWFQNSGQPKSLTSNFMKNLMLYNDEMNDNTKPIDMDTAAAAALPSYVDEEFENLSDQNEPYDYFDPLKFQHANQFNHYGAPSLNKQIYYNQNNREDNNNDEQQRVSFKNKNQRKPATHNDDDSYEDKDEKDLESLRKSHNHNSWNRKNNVGHNRNHVDNDDDDGDDDRVDNDTHESDTVKHVDNDNNGGYDTGFDYDEDEWINWNRKRSLPNEPLRPLKALEQKLTEALKFQSDALKLTVTTSPPPPPPPPPSSPTSTAR